LYSKIDSEFELKEKLDPLTEEQRKYKNELKELKSLCKDKIPDDLSSPITGAIFYNPVIAEDEHTYEKNAIEAWLEKFDTSPLEGKMKLTKSFIPNQSIKKLVKKYYDSHKDILLSKKISMDT